MPTIMEFDNKITSPLFAYDDLSTTNASTASNNLPKFDVVSASFVPNKDDLESCRTQSGCKESKHNRIISTMVNEYILLHM